MATGTQVAALYGALSLDKDQFEKDVQSSGGLFGNLTNMAKTAAVAIGAALIGAGAAAISMGDSYQKAINKLRVGAGQDLASLTASFDNVAKKVPQDLNTVAEVLDAVNDRSGLTGKGLEDLGKNLLDLARLTGGDPVSMTKKLLDVYSQWHVSTGDQIELNNELLRASDASGQSVEELSDSVTRFGPALRDAGFSLKGSIALLASLARGGVDGDVVIRGLQKSMGTFAKEGQTVEQGLSGVVAKIKELGPGAESTALALQTFGAKAGPQMRDAILDGRLSLEDMLAVMSDGSETIDQLGQDSLTLSDRFSMGFNNLTTRVGGAMQEIMPQIGDLVTGAFTAIGDGLTWVVENVLPPVIAGFQWFTENVLPALGTAWDNLQQTVGPIIEQVFNFLVTDVLPPLQEAFDYLANDLLPTLGSALGSLVNDFLMPLATTIGQIVAEDILPALVAGFQWLVDNVGPVLNAAFNILATQILPALKDGFDKIMTAMQPLIDWLHEHPEVVLGLIGLIVLTQVVPAFIAWAAAMLAANAPLLILIGLLIAIPLLVSAVSTAWDDGKQKGKDWAAAIRDANEAIKEGKQPIDVQHMVVSDFIDMIRTKGVFGLIEFDSAASTMADGFSKSGSWVVDTIASITGGLFGLKVDATKLSGDLGTALGQIATQIGSHITQVFNDVRNAFVGMANHVIDVVNDMIQAVNNFQIHIPRLAVGDFQITPAFNWGGLNIPMLRHLAAGTRDFEGGLSLVGEHGPELRFLPPHTQVFDTNTTRAMMGRLGQGGEDGSPLVGQMIVNGSQPGEVEASLDRVYRRNKLRQVMGGARLSANPAGAAG